MYRVKKVDQVKKVDRVRFFVHINPPVLRARELDHV